MLQRLSFFIRAESQRIYIFCCLVYIYHLKNTILKKLLMFAIPTMLFMFSYCKKTDSEKVPVTQNVKGEEATIDWQGCAFFTDHDITICFVGADEQRCPCNVECVWEGAVNATFHITTLTGLDTIITLTTNSAPAQLHSSETIGGKTIRFVNTATPIPFDCADYGVYEKYKAIVTVE
jgi:hypothetical protein